MPANINNLEQDKEKENYVISIPKMALLYFGTLGLYEVYWFFKQWQAIKYKNGKNYNVIIRTLLPYIFCFPLFIEIANLNQGNIKRKEPIFLAILYVIASLIGFIANASPSDFSLNPIGSLFLFALYLLSLIISFMILARIQKIANIAANDIKASQNSKMSLKEWLLIAIFCTIFFIGSAFNV